MSYRIPTEADRRLHQAMARIGTKHRLSTGEVLALVEGQQARSTREREAVMDAYGLARRHQIEPSALVARVQAARSR